ncbi:membrane protein [Erwinia rhapontici]|nr:membrane protein [Erwinia rhapontici]
MPLAAFLRTDVAGRGRSHHDVAGSGTLSRRSYPAADAVNPGEYLADVAECATAAGGTDRTDGDGWQDTLEGDIWLAVLQTQFGRAWQWQLALAVLCCLVLLFRRRLSGQGCQQTVLLLAVLQLSGLAFTGHAAMLDGWSGVFQRANQTVHLLSAAFWAGGLLPVVYLMRAARSPEHRYDAICTMMRFSRYGHLAVMLVVISGVINALLLLGWPLASFRLYSQLLVLKSLLVGVMMGIALFNRYWLVPRFQHSGAGAQQSFITSTLVEIALAAAVLLVVGIFATLEPA